MPRKTIKRAVWGGEKSSGLKTNWFQGLKLLWRLISENWYIIYFGNLKCLNKFYICKVTGELTARLVVHASNGRFQQQQNDREAASSRLLFFERVGKTPWLSNPGNLIAGFVGFIPFLLPNILRLQRKKTTSVRSARSHHLNLRWLLVPSHWRCLFTGSHHHS